MHLTVNDKSSILLIEQRRRCLQRFGLSSAELWILLDLQDFNFSVLVLFYCRGHIWEEEEVVIML